MTAANIWLDVYARALSSRFIRSALVYDLLYKLLGIALLAPVAAFVLNHLIRVSGGLTITNEAIAGFMLSVPGLLFVLVTLTLTLASFYAEQAGLMHIASGAIRGRPTGWADALATTVYALPRLVHLALWQAAILLAWLLPLVAVAGGAYLVLLREHDINWYLSNHPPELWAILGIGGLLSVIAAGMLLRYLVDWALSIPVCLYEQQRGRAALRRARDLVRGHRWHALTLLTLNLSLAAAASAALFWLADSLVAVVLGALQGIGPMIAATAVSLTLLLALAAFLSFLVLTVYAVVVMHLYLEIVGTDSIPTQRSETAARQLRIPRVAVVGLLITLLGASAVIAENRLQDLRVG
ncbi:MAG: glycerophosphoryl diester phosphodiesterase membrane domain-containing protein, partial [Thiohalocapsa sp.]